MSNFTEGFSIGLKFFSSVAGFLSPFILFVGVILLIVCIAGYIDEWRKS